MLAREEDALRVHPDGPCKLVVIAPAAADGDVRYEPRAYGLRPSPTPASAEERVHLRAERALQHGERFVDDALYEQGPRLRQSPARDADERRNAVRALQIPEEEFSAR